MRTLAPPRRPETPSEPSPPVRSAPPAPPRVAAHTIVLVTLGAILLTAVFNSDEMVKRADQMSFGWRRTVAVRLADADRDVSRALWLNRPRLALDHLFGHRSHAGSTLPPPTPPTTRPPVTTTPTKPTRPTTPTSRPSTPTTVPPVRPQRPTVANPLTIYLGGDSLGENLGSGFEQLVGGNRAIDVDADARVSTGLSRPDYFDWPAQLARILGGAHPPKVVVVMFGANDAQPIMTPSGPAQVGSPAWLAEYRRRVAATMDLLSSSAADVYWVGQPVMRSAHFAQRMNMLDDVYVSEARAHPKITFVDTRPTLADAQGRYTDYLPDSSGRMVQVRQADGIHVTMAGAARLAAAVEIAMRPRWTLGG